MIKRHIWIVEVFEKDSLEWAPLLICYKTREEARSVKQNLDKGIRASPAYYYNKTRIVRYAPVLVRKAKTIPFVFQNNLENASRTNLWNTKKY